MPFLLHKNLACKDFITDLPLCRILLENEAHYPWILLIPRRPQILRIIDLSLEDQWQLTIESNLAQQVMWTIFNPTQLNVAAIGNKTPQLHLHIIARFDDDPAWPSTVWDHPIRSAYPLEKKEFVVSQLKEHFNTMIKNNSIEC